MNAYMFQHGPAEQRWAVFVDLDAYQAVSHLGTSVNDSTAMENICVYQLAMPDARIQTPMNHL